MNQPNSQNDWQKRLEELEAEVNASSNKTEKNSPEEDYVASSSPMNYNSSQFSTKVQKVSGQIRQWFDQLPVLGKVIVAAVGVGVSLSLLKTVFQLVTSVLTLAVIGALGYVGYQVFIASKNKSNQ